MKNNKTKKLNLSIKSIKIVVIILLVLSLLLFPNPEQNFFIYLPWLILSIIIIIKLMNSK